MSPERPSLILSMSALIAKDAPLESPVSDCSWDQQPFYSPTGMDSFSFDDPPYSQHSSPEPTQVPEPVPAESRLKMRMTPDYSSDASDSQLCLPTSQVFDIPSADGAPSSPVAIRLPIKRPSSPTGSATSSGSAPKKPRNERLTTKEFVPPDVSGLSKREARLVKNRAAAFLSRQRKREEFEHMEVRVAELENENARLQALAQSAPEEQNMLSEIDHLRAQLAAAEQRERELSAQLSRPAPTVKMEAPEPRLPVSPARFPAAPFSQPLQLPGSGRSSASLSLLVLLCALPSIFGMPPHSQAQPFLQSTGSFPHSQVTSQPFGPSGMDLSSYFSPDALSWRAPVSMDLDRPTAQRRLEFVEDANALGLSGLDISFDAQASADGKIRVRIHHPNASSASSPALSAASYPMPSSPTFARPFALDNSSPWGMHAPMAQSFVPSNNNGLEVDPFFGVQDMSFGMDPSVLLGQSAERHIDTAMGRRRVRIALKSLPMSGGDGGEWEIELC